MSFPRKRDPYSPTEVMGPHRMSAIADMRTIMSRSRVDPRSDARGRPRTKGNNMLDKINGSRIGSADYDWDELVQEDRVHRLIYTDPLIFEAEMTNIFGAVWVYLGHESQIPNNDDYITVRMGLRPIILLRDSNGKVRALFNRCTHRGTTLCRKDKGSARIFTCPYHRSEERRVG